jgi:hypothetical protein
LDLGPSRLRRMAEDSNLSAVQANRGRVARLFLRRSCQKKLVLGL